MKIIIEHKRKIFANDVQTQKNAGIISNIDMSQKIPFDSLLFGGLFFKLNIIYFIADEKLI